MKPANRTLNTGIALAGLAAPFLVAYGCTTLALDVKSPRPSSSPNPAPLTTPILGPGAILVYIDPWFAGVLVFWESLIAAFATVFIAGVVWRWPLAAPNQLVSRGVLALMSLSLGTVLGAPWIYGLVQLLGRGH